MKITYLGTGAAEGVPAIFCNCDYCRAARSRGGRELRSRAQVLVDGELSIDFPPDSFLHAAHLGADFSALRYCLVTHAHMDHFYAHDFILRGYKFAWNMSSPALDIYGNAEVLGIFSECTRREMKQEVGEHIALHEVKPFEPVLFGGYTVHPLKAQHSSQEPLVYLIEKDKKRILHLCDTGTLTAESEEYLTALGGKPCDLVTLDCTFLWNKTSAGARHMGLDENARVIERLTKIGLIDGHTKKVITHFSHNSEPSKKNLKRAERECGMIAAYDGMTLDI